jgi:hypothetical protein
LNIQPQNTAAPIAPAKRSFAAMRHPGFRVQFVTFVFAMMADNIEHVISYWVMFQKFHSPARSPTVSIRGASSNAACCCLF